MTHLCVQRCNWFVSTGLFHVKRGCSTFTFLKGWQLHAIRGNYSSSMPSFLHYFLKLMEPCRDNKSLLHGTYSVVPQCPGCLWPFPQLFVRQVCGEQRQTAGLSIFRLYWSPHISSLFMHRHEHNLFPYSFGCRGNWVPIMRFANRSHLQIGTFFALMMQLYALHSDFKYIFIYATGWLDFPL